MPRDDATGGLGLGAVITARLPFLLQAGGVFLAAGLLIYGVIAMVEDFAFLRPFSMAGLESQLGPIQRGNQIERVLICRYTDGAADYERVYLYGGDAMAGIFKCPRFLDLTAPGQ